MCEVRAMNSQNRPEDDGERDERRLPAPGGRGGYRGGGGRGRGRGGRVGGGRGGRPVVDMSGMDA